MQTETNINLKPYNTFGLPAVAQALIRIKDATQISRLLEDPELARREKFVLGGGSNVVFTRDVAAIVLKVELMGRRLVKETRSGWIVEAGAGESWQDLVTWTLDQGWPGLENLALIPGTAGAAPIQNIGAYGVELKDRFESLDAVDLKTGQTITLNGPECRFGYRDSIFKNELAGQCLITRIRLKLPKPWRPVLSYPDLQNLPETDGTVMPDARQICDRITGLRRQKLPDPATIGNAGSFFKNPVVPLNQLASMRENEPGIVSYPASRGMAKISAGWLIESCGWKGKWSGNAGVYDKQALVLVNGGSATGREIMALAKAIQHSVQDRFGVLLEMEPRLV